ncbi:hypothetical protein [Frankia gtarii]|uniref:hypothetical protein n=1 Tax=Frankia gtarii TaxID=2950102 RepID=UPI0021BE9799|nr:hypothetical protein [Frankia gtarii]
MDFLAVHPGRPFSLTEIAGALRINAASTLSVLMALTDSGYVVRHPLHKTYTLGAALVAVGQAALVQHPLLQAAQDELALLAGELEAQCVASVLMGNELVAVVAEGRARRTEVGARVGTRLPFSAPFGAPFAAYGDDALRRRWLQRSHGVTTADRALRLEQALAEVAERGYEAGPQNETRQQLRRALETLADDPGNAASRAEIERLLDDLADRFVTVNLDLDEVVAVANVTAPVFTPAGEVVMILTANGFVAPLTGAAAVDVGERLRASADMMAARTFGGAAPRRPRQRDREQRIPTARS